MLDQQQHILNPEEYIERGKYMIAQRIALIFSVVFLGLTILFYGMGRQVFWLYLIVFILSFSALLFLLKTNRYKPVYWLYIIATSSVMTYSLLFIDNILHYPDMIWILTVILIAFIGIGTRTALFFIVYFAFLIFYYLIFRYNEQLPNIKSLSVFYALGNGLEVLLSGGMTIYLFYLYVNYRNMAQTVLEKGNIALRKQIEDNIILLKEVHHRVKNNLQIVISLLRMQYNEEAMDEQVKRQFSEAISRIMSISLVHEKLYSGTHLTGIIFQDYIDELVGEIGSLHVKNIRTSIQYQLGDHSIGLKTIVPLGLILNELLTNTIKHASGDAPILVKIEFSSDDGEQLNFSYSDNGKWVNQCDKQVSFGLELIELLTQQMEGNMERFDCHFAFRLKNLDLE